MRTIDRLTPMMRHLQDEQGKPWTRILLEACRKAERIEEVALTFKVSVATVYRWCHKFQVTPPCTTGKDNR